MPYVTETMIRISPSANVTLPHQSTRAGFGVLRSSSFRYAHTVPNSPTGTEIRNTSRQSIGASRPPSTSPTNMPLTPTMLLMPERHAALVGGERVGDDRRRVGQQERRADPLHDAEHDQIRRPRAPVHPVHRQHQRRERVDDEAEVVHLHPPVHVAQAARGSRSARSSRPGSRGSSTAGRSCSRAPAGRGGCRGRCPASRSA